MKKYILLISLLAVVTGAYAQGIKMGLTARGGAFKTVVGADSNVGENNSYGSGFRAEAGFWIAIPTAEKTSVQLTLFRLAEWQNAGHIGFKDERGYDYDDYKVTDRNVAMALQALYMFNLNEKWRIGAGLGSKYEYLSVAREKDKSIDYYNGAGQHEKYKASFANLHRRDVTLHLPLEIQLKLSEQFALVGQAHLQLTNRLAASETAFKEHDLGGSLGVNYTIGF